MYLTSYPPPPPPLLSSPSFPPFFLPLLIIGQVDLRHKTWLGITGNRCGSGVEWVPFALDDVDTNNKNNNNVNNANTNPNLRGNLYENTVRTLSWKSRKGMDPISVGPHWPEVKQSLEASGVNVWWYPHPPSQEQHDAPPLAREPPHLGAAGEEVPESRPLRPADARDVEDEGIPNNGVGAGGKGLRPGSDGGGAFADMNDNVGSGIGFEESGEVRQRTGGRGNVGGGMLPVKDPGGPGGREWITLAGVVSCVMIVAVGLVRRKRGGRRRGGRRKPKTRTMKNKRTRDEERFEDWSRDAFSTGAISPLGVTSFVWQGGNVTRKDR